jgi:hypothetical protein
LTPWSLATEWLTPWSLATEWLKPWSLATFAKHLRTKQ